MGKLDLGARRAYQAIAPVYDAFTANHDFGLWLGNLLPAIEAHGVPRRTLLDVGCGTGKSFLPMLDRGWTVTACDISAAMVAQAASKLGADASATVVVADMRELPCFGEFGLVWCLTDPINYLLTEDELDAALAGMVRNLDPAGVLAFDLNTLLSFRSFFAEEISVEGPGGRMVWKGHGSPTAAAGSIVEATFLADQSSSGIESVPASLHRVRHFPESSVLAALARAGAECVDVFGINYDAILKQPLDEGQHTKAVYLAKRAE